MQADLWVIHGLFMGDIRVIYKNKNSYLQFILSEFFFIKNEKKIEFIIEIKIYTKSLNKMKMVKVKKNFAKFYFAKLLAKYILINLY